MILTRPIYHRIQARHATPAHLVLSHSLTQKDYYHGGHGYIAGTADGIVTVAGQPAQREVWVLSVSDHRLIRRVWSDVKGRYMITHLDPDKEYLVLARDYARQLEPFAYDYVKPATDLTLTEQQALMASWQADTAN